MTHKTGYRGYIGSRPYRGDKTPQHVQNLVIRDFCLQHRFYYLLSNVEFSMPGCYIMFEEILRGLEKLHGIVLYSIFMLPKNKDNRKVIYERVLTERASLHGALENISIKNDKDIESVEDLWLIQQAVSSQSDPLISVKSNLDQLSPASYSGIEVIGDRV